MRQCHVPQGGHLESDAQEELGMRAELVNGQREAASVEVTSSVPTGGPCGATGQSPSMIGAGGGADMQGGATMCLGGGGGDTVGPRKPFPRPAGGGGGGGVVVVGAATAVGATGDFVPNWGRYGVAPQPLSRLATRDDGAVLSDGGAGRQRKERASWRKTSIAPRSLRGPHLPTSA